MEDIYLLTLSLSIISLLFVTMLRMTSNPKAKQKDKHYSDLLNVKDLTIEDLKKTSRGYRSKIQHLESGPTYEGDEEGSIEDIMSSVYDKFPAYAKKFISREETIKLLDNPEKLKELVATFRGKSKTNKEEEIIDAL